MREWERSQKRVMEEEDSQWGAVPCPAFFFTRLHSCISEVQYKPPSAHFNLFQKELSFPSRQMHKSPIRLVFTALREVKCFQSRRHLLQHVNPNRRANS